MQPARAITQAAHSSAPLQQTAMLTTLPSASDTQLATTQQRAAQQHSPPPAGLISPRQRRGAGGFANQSEFDHPFEPQLSSSLLRVKFGPKYRDPFANGTHSAGALALAQSRGNSPTRRRWLQQNGSAAADDAASSPQQQQLLLTDGDPNDSSMRSDLNESEPARDTPVPTPRHTLGAAASAASSPASPADPPLDPLDVDALSEQIAFDMSALGSLKAERDSLHKKAAATMTKLREQEEILRVQRTKAGVAPAESNEPSTAAKMRSIFDTQMQAYDERVAELEYSVHEAAKRMALEQQRQQQQQQQEAQAAPTSASRAPRDSAAASIASPAQAASASNHSLSSGGHVFTPAPPLDFAEAPALAFSDPSGLLESKMLEGVLPLHLHKALAAYKASVVARVTARDQQLAQQSAQRLRETQKDAARQYRALADTYSESLHAASLQSEELAHYQQGVAFFEQQLRVSQAQLAESEERRRELTAHFERVQADHVVELQAAAQAAAAAQSAAEAAEQAMPTSATHPYSFVAGGSDASSSAPSAAPAAVDSDRASLIAAFHSDISARDARIVELDEEIQSIRAFVDSFAAQDPAAQTALQLRETQKELQAAREQIVQLSEALANQQQAASSKQTVDAESASQTGIAAEQLSDQASAFEAERSAWAVERSALESRLQVESAATTKLREELALAQQALTDSNTKLGAAEARATELGELPAKLAAAEAAASNVPLLVDQLNQLAAQLQEKTRALDASQTASAAAQTEFATLRQAHNGCAASLKKSQRKLSTLREARSEFERQISQLERQIDATSREVMRMASGRSADADRIRELEDKLSQSLALQETMAKAQQASLQQTKQAMRSRMQKQQQQQQPPQQQPTSFTPSLSLPSAAAPSSTASFSSAAAPTASAAMSHLERSTPQLRAPFTPLLASLPAASAAAPAVAASPPFVRDDLAQQLSELQALRQSLATDPVMAGTASAAAPRSVFGPPAVDGETKEEPYRFASAPTQQQQQEFASLQQRSYPQTQQRLQPPPHQPMHEPYFHSTPSAAAASAASSSASDGAVIVSSHTIPAMTVQTTITPVRQAAASDVPAAPYTPQPPPSMPPPQQQQTAGSSLAHSALRSPPWSASLPTPAATSSSSSDLFRAADAFLARQEQER